jgi:hypothetical protein
VSSKCLVCDDLEVSHSVCVASLSCI